MLPCCLQRNVEASCHTLRHRLPPPTNLRLVSSTCHGPSAECIALAAWIIHSTRWSQILAHNPDFCLPHLHSTPPLRGSPSEYRHEVRYRKTTQWCGYPTVKKNLKIRLLVLTECTNVTDGQTDIARRHRPRFHSIERQKCMAQGGRSRIKLKMLSFSYYFQHRHWSFMTI